EGFTGGSAPRTPIGLPRPQPSLPLPEVDSHRCAGTIGSSVRPLDLFPRGDYLGAMRIGISCLSRGRMFLRSSAGGSTLRRLMTARRADLRMCLVRETGPWSGPNERILH